MREFVSLTLNTGYSVKRGKTVRCAAMKYVEMSRFWVSKCAFDSGWQSGCEKPQVQVRSLDVAVEHMGSDACCSTPLPQQHSASVFAPQQWTMCCPENSVRSRYVPQ